MLAPRKCMLEQGYKHTRDLLFLLCVCGVCVCVCYRAAMVIPIARQNGLKKSQFSIKIPRYFDKCLTQKRDTTSFQTTKILVGFTTNHPCCCCCCFLSLLPFSFIMIIPVRCFTCGKVIGNKWETYLSLLQADFSEG